tara:strand:+ start:285 stop:503 length:219 start_codon:yes stop_codon:yes gene_type:complete
MAQFMGELEGNRGMASRLGTKSSGLWGHLRGWNVGVKVDLSHTEEGDKITIWKTGGSNSPSTTELLVELTDK